MTKRKRCLTQQELKQYLKYDYKTGVFTRIKLNRFDKRNKLNAIAGSQEVTGYLVVRLNGNVYKAHRLAWLYMTGNWPNNEIDHLNRIKTDNRWCNLREATDKDQNGNKSLRKDNTSGLRRVSWHKRDKVWQAYIFMNNKQKYLGSFSSKEEAYKIYEKRAKDYFGEFYNG